MIIPKTNKKTNEKINEKTNEKITVFSNERKIKPIKSDIFNNDNNGKSAGFPFNKQNKIDGLTLLKAINNEVITACFFDPQYRGIMDRMKYGNEGKRQKKRYKLKQMSLELIINFIKEISRTLIKSGHLFLWTDKFHLCEGIHPWIEGTKLSIVDLISWDKDKMGMGYRTRRQVEYLLVLQKKPAKAKGYWQKHDIKDIWTEKIEKKIHPHQKPIHLQKALIAAVSNEEDIILDPCAGSYSVLQSCLDMNRKFIGADIA